MDKYINPDDIIGRMHSVAEEAAAIIDHVEAAYFQGDNPTEEDLLRIRTEYSKIGKILRAALDLLQIAEEENTKWQQRPAAQIKQEAMDDDSEVMP